MIKLKGVSKKYQEKEVISELDVEFLSGKTTVILAPSGHGKTTMLRLITGLTSASAGEVLIDGQSPLSFGPRDRARAFGYVLQEGGLFPHLTVEENITLSAKIMEQGDCSKRLQDLLELVHLAPEVLSRYPRELSGGQRQRVAIARALMLDPKVLIFDEPLSALDPITRRHLQVEFRKIFRRLNKTVLFVTHNIDEAAYLSDQIAFLYHGRLAQKGTWHEFSQNPTNQFIRDFIQAQKPLAAHPH